MNYHYNKNEADARKASAIILALPSLSLLTPSGREAPPINPLPHYSCVFHSDKNGTFRQSKHLANMLNTGLPAVLTGGCECGTIATAARQLRCTRLPVGVKTAKR